MEKKRNKKAIIITALVMLTGILLVLAGLFGGWFAGLFNKGFDYRNISKEDLGKSYKTDIKVDYDDLDIKNSALQNFGGNDGFAMILLDLSDLSEKERNLYFSKIGQHITIEGRLRALGDDEYAEVAGSMYKVYDEIYYRKVENGSWAGKTLEEFHEKLITEMIPLLPYCFKVKSVSAFNWMPFVPAGAVLFILSLIVEICFVFKLKKRIVLPIVYGLLIIVPSVMLFNHIRTMMTVKKAGGGLYTMKNIECTDTDGMLGSGAANIEELLDWIFNNHLYGIRPRFNVESYGCAAFAAVTPEGKHLFGRNFDYPETDTLLIYSHPEGCYESIGVADLGVFGVSQNYPISPDSPLGRLLMVITPYVVVDGMNEKGVGAGILELNIGETHQDNGKPDLLVFCAVRAILDKCASVDEAIELLSSYDMHSPKVSYHLFITDKTGRYVVVEWLDNEMVVVEHPCCTNSVVAPGEHYNKGLPDSRLPAMEECLGDSRKATEEQAMAILGKVKNKSITEWSCVYNLEDFTVSICLDGDYTKVYTFNVKELR